MNCPNRYPPLKKIQKTIARTGSIYFSLLLAGTLLVYLNPIATAQTTSTAVEDTAETQAKKIIYVNPNTGEDRLGNGSESSPFKTLSHALKIAETGTKIFLLPGVYNAETGENFPIVLKPNITIIGNPVRGSQNNIMIQGSGTFSSAVAGQVQATVVARSGVGVLRGVTVMNISPRGYGLWLESGSHQIDNNIFTGSGEGGIFISGNEAPIITNNYLNNIGNGLVVAGNATPQITHNTFNNSNYGVQVRENGSPVLSRNRITGNKIGILLEGNGRTILRNNTIDTSLTDGLVVKNNGTVNLGTSNDPGGNTFYRNSNLDIRNLASIPIPAFGNQLEKGFEGAVDLAAESKPTTIPTPTTIPMAVSSPEGSSPPPQPVARDVRASSTPTEILIAVPSSETDSTAPQQVTRSAETSETTSTAIPIAVPSPEGSSPPPQPVVRDAETSSTATEIPMAVPSLETDSTAPQQVTRSAETSETTPTAIPIPVPSPETNSPTSEQQSASQSKIVVPPSNTSPVDSPSSTEPEPATKPAATQVSPNRKTLSELLILPPNIIPNPNQSIALSSEPNLVPIVNIESQYLDPNDYLVMAETLNESQEEELTRIYPHAVATIFNRQSMWKMGAFRSWENANQMLAQLNNFGFSGLIIRQEELERFQKLVEELETEESETEESETTEGD